VWPNNAGFLSANATERKWATSSGMRRKNNLHFLVAWENKEPLVRSGMRQTESSHLLGNYCISAKKEWKAAAADGGKDRTKTEQVLWKKVPWSLLPVDRFAPCMRPSKQEPADFDASSDHL
jgi:hypothetical protein